MPTPRVTPEHQLEPYQKSLAPADHEQRNVQVKLVPETNVIGQPSHRVVRTEHQSIGLLLKRVSSVPGSAYITSIQPGTLADISGKIRVGDNLVAINGQKVDQLSLSDIHDLVRAPCCPQLRPLHHAHFLRNVYFPCDMIRTNTNR